MSMNGKILPAARGVLQSSNRSFRYGDGFFETIRASRGRILWAGRHFGRIQQTASLLKMILPREFNREYFEQQLLDLYEKNHPGAPAARLRLSFFREEGGFYTPCRPEASFLIESVPLEQQQFVLNKKGLMIGVFPDLRKNQDFLAGIKSCSALVYVMAGIYAETRQWDDCILLNQEGFVAEAISSNLFIMKDQELFTPSLDQGCVNGIMRSVILDIASLLKIKTHEVMLSPEDLLGADELFLTNTIKGVSWVSGFGPKRYFNRKAPLLVDYLNGYAEDARG